MCNKAPALFGWQKFTMKCFTATGTRDSAVRCAQPHLKPQLLGDGHSESVAASGAEHDLNACFMSSTQRAKIRFADGELRIQQSAIDIKRYESDVGLHA